MELRLQTEIHCVGNPVQGCHSDHATHVGPEGKLFCDKHGIPREKRAVCLLVVNQDDQVLGVTRRHDHTSWGKPGGKVDTVDPDDKAACVREAREEVQIRVVEHDLVVVYAAWDGHGYWCTTYYTPTFEGTPSTPKEDGGKPAGLVGFVSWDTMTAGPFGVYNSACHDAFRQMKLKGSYQPEEAINHRWSFRDPSDRR